MEGTNATLKQTALKTVVGGHLIAAVAMAQTPTHKVIDLGTVGLNGQRVHGLAIRRNLSLTSVPLNRQGNAQSYAQLWLLGGLSHGLLDDRNADIGSLPLS
jgi:hypothetical protein